MPFDPCRIICIQRIDCCGDQTAINASEAVAAIYILLSSTRRTRRPAFRRHSYFLLKIRAADKMTRATPRAKD